MAANGQSFEAAMLGLTESKRVLKLHRLAAGTMVSSSTGDVAEFTLKQFVEALSTVRTRSEKRKDSMMHRFATPKRTQKDIRNEHLSESELTPV